MADRSSTYSEKERDAAITVLADELGPGDDRNPEWRGKVVDAIFHAIGMTRQSLAWRSLADAPHDRDIVLRRPKGQPVRAVWWANWVDPADPLPWAWREARADGTVGADIPEADGWRELPL